MVKSKVTVSISSLRMVTTKNSFLENYALCLELDSLKEVAKLKLNAGKFRDASSNFFIHGPSNLKKGIDTLAVQLESSFKSTLLISLLRTSKELSHIIVLKLKMLHNREDLSKI